MRWLSDEAVAHLREVADEPDFSGTRYRLVRELARGGMGIVYEADDLLLERQVAIKVLRTELATRDDAQRMREEAKIVARLEHPGIVPVHDAGELPDGRVFYAMKLVRGVRLDHFARQGHPRAELLRAFLRVCEAVAFAHAAGVIHRDLKPDNVMVGELGAVLVMDWGVATSANTSINTIAGTPGYMAPEQERGDASIDARADVFALGRMLHELAGSDVRPLVSIARKAMAANREERYADAHTLADDIARWLDQEPVLAHRENILERTARFVSRHRVIITMIVAYLLMRAFVLFWYRR